MFASEDGKDQETTGEDGFASYALKMWGKVIGDANMEKRGEPNRPLPNSPHTDKCAGNLMLALQARSFNTYFYLLSNSVIQPARYLPNKLAGTLFENKIDYATWYSDDPAVVHTSHMMPINPSSSLTRPRAFVQEEWDAIFSHGRATKDGPEGEEGKYDAWRGILYANLALADPKESFKFFRDGVDGHWDERWVDGSASRTWYLVWAAGLVELESRRAPPVTGSRLQLAREREMRKQGRKQGSRHGSK